MQATTFQTLYKYFFQWKMSSCNHSSAEQDSFQNLVSLSAPGFSRNPLTNQHIPIQILS